MTEKKEPSFTIVEFMMVVAILMILAGMFGPHFAQSGNKAKPTQSTQQTPTARGTR